MTKRTLYDHFDSKDALIAAALERQEALALDRVEGWGADVEGDAVALVETIFVNLADWAADPDWQSSGFTRAAMELAGLPGHPARAVARRHKAAVEGWFAERFREAGCREPAVLAREIMLLLEGCLSLMLLHGDRSYADTARNAARRLVQDDSRPTGA